MTTARDKKRNEEAIRAEERFVVDVQHRIQTLLNDRGMTYANLASDLNVSGARVSQMFGDEASNLTLRTVARIFHALGEECEITSPRLEELGKARKETPRAGAWGAVNLAGWLEGVDAWSDPVIQGQQLWESFELATDHGFFARQRRDRHVDSHKRRESSMAETFLMIFALTGGSWGKVTNQNEVQRFVPTNQNEVQRFVPVQLKSVA